MTTPSPRDRAIRRVVAGARAIVTYHAGLPVGVQRLNGALRELSFLEPTEFGPVTDYLEAVVALPLGSERLETTREALERFDIQLEAANVQYRDAVFAFCFDLLERFGADVGPTPEVETRRPMRKRDA